MIKTIKVERDSKADMLSEFIEYSSLKDFTNKVDNYANENHLDVISVNYFDTYALIVHKI